MKYLATIMPSGSGTFLGYLYWKNGSIWAHESGWEGSTDYDTCVSCERHDALTAIRASWGDPVWGLDTTGGDFNDIP